MRPRLIVLVPTAAILVLVAIGGPADAAKPSRSFTKDFYAIFYQDCGEYTVTLELEGTDIFTISYSQARDRVKLVEQGVGDVTVTNLDTLETVEGTSQVKVTIYLASSEDLVVGQTITDHYEVSGLNAVLFIDGQDPIVVSGRAVADLTYVVTGFDKDGNPLFELIDVQEETTPNMSHLSPLLCDLVA